MRVVMTGVFVAVAVAVGVAVAPVGVAVAVAVEVGVAVWVGVLDGVGVSPGEPHGLRAVDELRGLGVPALKSVLFWSVSVQPLPARSTAVVFDGAAVGAKPSKKVVP